MSRLAFFSVVLALWVGAAACRKSDSRSLQENPVSERAASASNNPRPDPRPADADNDPPVDRPPDSPSDSGAGAVADTASTAELPANRHDARNSLKTHDTGDLDEWPSYDLPLQIEIEVPEVPEGICESVAKPVDDG